MKERLKGKIKNYLNSISDRLLDKVEHRKLICEYTYIVMAVISFTMTVINIFTDVGILVYATLGMGICSVINLFLARKLKRGVEISSSLFFFEIIALFSFFVISGNPKGFSIIWLSLLPAIAVLFFGKKKGSLLSFIMFIVLVFFLWMPIGHKLLFPEAVENYSETFRLRFPFLYVGCYLLAYILETIQSIAYNAVEKSNEKNIFFTKHDYLTGLYNRAGILELLSKEVKNPENKRIGVGILDIDNFKDINDKNGHVSGDSVLIEFGKLLSERNGKIHICRWGGDEFAFAYFNNDVTEKGVNKFRESVKNMRINVLGNKELNISISVGVYETSTENVKNANAFDELLKRADNLLYNAKQTGKDKVIFEIE